jgi:Xaa-Pro aminopeptidase
MIARPPKMPERGFDTAEFAARCTAAQAVMAARGLGAMLFASEAEIRYFTGFMTQFWQSPTRPWFVILPPTGKPIAVIPTIGGPLMRDCYVDDVRSWASPAASDDGISLLLATLREVMASDKLGVPMGRETALRVPLGDVLTLIDALEGTKLVDVTTEIQHIRMIKSPAEIAKTRHVCSLISDVFATVPDWTHAGMPLSDLFRHFKIRALEAGVDDVSYLVGAAGPGGYFDIIAPPNDRPLASGDVFMLDTGSVWDGYFCDFDRNFAIASASDAAMAAHQMLFDATEAALAVARPGIRASDLYAAMDGVLRPDDAHRGDAGNTGDDVGRYGHGLGIQLTEPPSHTIWDQTELTANMALTLEPSIIYEGGFLMVAEENILITDTGVELLSSRAARDLPIIG